MDENQIRRATCMDVIGTITAPEKNAATYVRLSEELRRPIDGGCSCQFCKAHPERIPAWDTLVIPHVARSTGKTRESFGYSYAVHMPDISPEARAAMGFTRGTRS